MRRPRHLSPEERALWDHVTRHDDKLHPQRPVATPGVEPRPVAPVVIRQEDRPLPVPRFSIGEKADHRRSDDLLPGLAEDMARAPLRMDAKSFGKMARGKLVPEARIDLHGMTLAEAHPELIRFILSAQSDGLRLVLVITGKGKGVADPVPRPIGALRHQVPHWLRLPPLALSVQQVAEAHLKHGGSGAFYVYLRRR